MTRNVTSVSAFQNDWFNLSAMSLAEVKASIKEMSVEERLEIAALIAHLNRADDPEYREELDRRMPAMDAGRKTSGAELEQGGRASPRAV
jgi:hypothetical protein